MAEKIKLLQLAPRFVFPPDDGGKIGIANIYKEFSRQGFDVTLFCYFDNMPDRPSIEDASQYGKLLLYKHSTENTLVRIIKSIALNRSIYIDKHINDKIKRFFDELLMQQRFDVIHVDHICMAPLGFYVKRHCNVPLGIRLHNIEWLIWYRYYQSLKKLDPKRSYIRHQAKLLRQAEGRFYRDADACFAITKQNARDALEIAPEANISVASAGVDPQEWQPEVNVERNPYQIIIATTFHWIHNVEGIRWYIEKVHPIVRAKIPQVRITLIGKEIPDWLYKLSDIGVDALGYVDKVQPYLNQAAVYIVPLFVGSGIRIKILEAMAMGLPVVATTIAAEGIETERSQGLLIADRAEDFAKEIIELLTSSKLRSNSGSAARKYVIENFDWKKNVSIMAEQYRRLIRTGFR